MISACKGERCRACHKKGFQGREAVRETTEVYKDEGLCNLVYWDWICKYCKTKNSLIWSIMG